MKIKIKLNRRENDTLTKNPLFDEHLSLAYKIQINVQFFNDIYNQLKNSRNIVKRGNSCG